MYELIAQNIRERFQMMSIVERVRGHAFGQWTARPICFLRSLLQLHVEESRDEMVQPELADAQEAAGEHRVENPGGDKTQALAQEPQIVIRAVHDQLVAFEDFEERFELRVRERVYQLIAPFDADLNEAKLFGVGVQAVSFGVERNPFGLKQFRKKPCYLFIRINHGAI